ncbi:MAG: hypothetical protein QOK20_1650, partial [Acidimicrobiaceae bacterium]|nr:hypothetical protein [Acidimicrobiaceae bacterium]
MILESPPPPKSVRGVRGHLLVLRLVSMFALLSIVPLGLLTYLTIHLTDQAVVGQVKARVRTTAAVTAVLLEQGMGGVAGLAASYAGRPALIDAVADGTSAQFDRPAIDSQLAQLRWAEPGIAGVFVADTSCRVTQVEPVTPELVGADQASRDWCQGVKAFDHGYVSDGYRADLPGHPLVVGAVVLVRASSSDGSGRPLAILGIEYRLDYMRAIADQIAQAQGIRLTITDREATVLIGSTKSAVGLQGLSSGAADTRVAAALAGHSGETRSTTGNGDSLSAFAPVPGLGWSIVAEVPARDALASVRRLRSTVVSVAGLLGLVLLAGIVGLARAQRLRREAAMALIAREARTSAILQAAGDAFISIDAAGVSRAWNRQAEALFGWTEAEAIGRRLSDTIIPPEGLEDHRKRMADLLPMGDGTLSTGRTEITVMHKDGHRFPAEFAVWQNGSGDEWRMSTFLRDITERKRAEADLADARDLALEASRSKSDFLATMSHEIRTPMNGVIGLTGLLLDSELTETQRHHAEGVRASGEALLGVINDILDFSKIEAGKLELETVDFEVANAIEEVAALVAESARAKGLELVTYCRPEVPASVRGDVGRVRQILLNFATNAVKFTDSGEVVIRAGLDDPGDDDTMVLRFEVADTGVGVAPALAERLFESFSQADASTTRRYGGSGLGLAICRRLAEAMGGTVGVDERPGVGSIFWARLPLAPASAPGAPTDADRRSLAGRRMLVVDDNQTNRLVLASQLRNWDITADMATDAAQALDGLRRAVADGEGYDLALLDMAMPGMDGLQLARAVRLDADLAAVQLVLLSSVTVESADATRAGFAARLTKPVRLSALYDVLVRAVAPHTRDAPVARPAPTVAARSRGTLLVVEDQAINQEVARGMAAKLGYGSDVAADGIEALDALQRRSYDAVLMDCHMPLMDGFDAAREIRRREAGGHHMPIIAMTAAALSEDRDRCLAAGMDDFLSKPIKIRELQRTLDRWLHEPDPVGADHPAADEAVAADGARGEATNGAVDVRGAVDVLGVDDVHGADDVLDAAQFDWLRQLAEASADPGLLRSFVDQYLDQAATQVG